MDLPARLRPPSTLRTGEGPDVAWVAVPGLGLSVHGWSATLRALVRATPGAGALSVALPAFGLPAGRGVALDPRSSAQRLISRLDELGVGRVVLLGHSASCQVVAEVAGRAPERVAALVLVGPTTDPEAMAWPSLVRRWLRTARREPLWQAPMLLRDYTYSGLISFARALDSSRRHRLDDVLPTVRCPTVLVRGSHDHVCPASWLARLARRNGRAVASTLPVGAHMVPLTHPLELAHELRSCLPGHAAT